MMLALCELSIRNLQSVDSFISLAARMISALRGHISSQAHVRTLFWLCYVIDKDLSLRTGCPSAINDDQCNIFLPRIYLQHMSRSPSEVQPFPTDLKLSIIKPQAYDLLYSASAQQTSDTELLRTIRELDEELER
ncbi:MAG: hypothetical protein M1834_001421 [Cirrosporium novae-zelandiae]|nr:MAG: hypothetical protein M1834_001421 [Cirrosporium novae-zelandiae]